MQVRHSDFVPLGAIEPRSGGLSAFGRALVARGLVSPLSAQKVETRNQTQKSRLTQAYGYELAIPREQLAKAEAEIAHLGLIDPIAQPPDARLVARLGIDAALRHAVLPWRTIAGQTIILCSNPDGFLACKDALVAIFGPVRIALAADSTLMAALRRIADPDLALRAEAMVPMIESCRDWNTVAARNFGLALVLIIFAAWLVAPLGLVTVLTFWAILTLVAHSALKLAATVATLRHGRTTTAQDPEPENLPIVSILVPLFREKEIAGHLVKRLSALDYPHDLLDVCLLLEADDLTTQTALRQTNLPRWMRAIVVPKAHLKTKPRALNFGLNFARGDIIGVYDAEDAPATDQIRRVVARFAACDPDVACLQGVLDFYNSQTNWLSRCFAIEYATWFRIVLPGLQRLGLVIPLGGTTLFFRRSALEELGGWDAHNVTEDADLGIRLARHGYQTELLPTVTEEEANCRPWPWVKQRSRWLKGYAITYGVHMKNPTRLWNDLGPWRFFGVQLLLLGTLSQFVLAPLLWSFWALPLGFWHPLKAVLPDWGFWCLGGIFLGSEVLNITVAAIAATKAGKPHLIKWAPTLHLYFPLAAMAVYKGLLELFWRPFYWDKTEHGVFAPTDLGPAEGPT